MAQKGKKDHTNKIKTVMYIFELLVTFQKINIVHQEFILLGMEC